MSTDGWFVTFNDYSGTIFPTQREIIYKKKQPHNQIRIVQIVLVSGEHYFGSFRQSIFDFLTLNDVEISSNNMSTRLTFIFNIYIFNHIGGVMVRVLTSSAIDCWLEPRSGQTKDYEIGMCCFFTKHAALRRKSRQITINNEIFNLELKCQWISYLMAIVKNNYTGEIIC